jgi:hypothetical protein
MAVIALGFIGFPLQHGERVAVGYEFAVLVVLVSLILLSRLPGLIFLLPIAWFSHGLWDLAHLMQLLPLDKPGWVVQLCVSYDWLVAICLFGRFATWRDSLNVNS